jgi:hypothetical protein
MLQRKSTFSRTGTTKPHFNPGQFASALTEKYYPKGPGLGVELNHERNKLVDRLRKRPDDDEASDLATKLEACRKNKRCQSAACP